MAIAFVDDRWQSKFLSKRTFPTSLPSASWAFWTFLSLTELSIRNSWGSIDALHFSEAERTAFLCFAGWGCKVCCNSSHNLISLKILCCVLTSPKQGYSLIWSTLKATRPGVAYLKRWFISAQLIVELTHLSCDTIKFCLSYIAQKKINRIWMTS